MCNVTGYCHPALMRAIQEPVAKNNADALRDVEAATLCLETMKQAVVDAESNLEQAQSRQQQSASIQRKQGQVISRLQAQQQVGWNDTLSREICVVILSKTSRYHARMCAVSSELLGGVVRSAEPLKFVTVPYQRQRLAAATSHSLALSADGLLFSWGDGEYGKLGLGDVESRHVPTLVQGKLGGKVVAQASTRDTVTVCVTTGGAVYSWGRLFTWAVPVLVPRLVGGLLQGQAVAQVTAGSGFIVCVTVAGEVFSWGVGDSGRLGLGDNDDRELPTLVQGQLQGKTVAKVSAGKSFAFCVTTDGEVFSWGCGHYGQLGVADRNPRLVPALIQRLQGKPVAQVDAGFDHAAAVTVDGALYSWGDNEEGQLGLGDTDDISILAPVLVQGELQGETVVQVSAGFRITACVTEKGAVFAWGNSDYQIDEDGDWSVDSALVPRLVEGELQGKEVVQVAAGEYHLLCATVEEAVYVWGQDGIDDGILGLGEDSDFGVSMPTLIDGQAFGAGCEKGWAPA